MVYTHYANFHLLLHAILDRYLAFTYNLLSTTKYFKLADRFLTLRHCVKSVNVCWLSSILRTKNSTCDNYLQYCVQKCELTSTIYNIVRNNRNDDVYYLQHGAQQFWLLSTITTMRATTILTVYQLQKIRNVYLSSATLRATISTCVNCIYNIARSSCKLCQLSATVCVTISAVFTIYNCNIARDNYDLCRI